MKKKLKNYYFTFMLSQATAKNYVKIRAYDPGQARDIMFGYFGSQWAFQYDQFNWYTENGFTQADKYGLTELYPMFDKATNDLINEAKREFYISKREQIFAKAGYDVEEISCGSGGTWRVIEKASGKNTGTWLQIGCGHGTYNYAKCVKLK